MKYPVQLEIENSRIDLEIWDEFSPNTVDSFLKSLPFSVDLNVWGEEIYSSSSPVIVSEEKTSLSWVL
ncbi:MAG: cyclophilin-like family protein [Nitrosopumilaceae archaeon]